MGAGSKPAENNRKVAAENRLGFALRGIRVFSLIGTSGAGKTELLRRTHEILQGRLQLETLVTSKVDQERLSALGIPTYQVYSDAHGALKAKTIGEAVGKSTIGPGTIIFIEHPGNLFSPWGFDLGETCRILVHSVPEGHDQPIKYPGLYRGVDLILVNKLDLLPFTDFTWKRFHRNLRRAQSNAQVIGVSCRSGFGLTAWGEWLLNFLGEDPVESSSSLQKNFAGPVEHWF
ncbi:MAG TPA: hydrogenase nickel incorporation protein HypB [Bacillota bacterium]